MADDKLREAALKPIATIKKPVIAAEKKEEVKAETPKAEVKKAAEKKTTAKKTAVKKTATKKEETAVKEEPKAAEKKEAAKKPAVKKVTAAKPAAKKAEPKEEKPAAKKTTATKAAATKTNIVLQYADKSVTYDTFVENAKNVWQYDMGRDVSEIKTLELYVKPEEERVYFVVNGEVHADFGM
ncbi:DUF6465 family protein [Butyrivibrio sp. AE3004]|uniref:DUF6465 family protein n=1 Tax=Butyrivibrio sp. AE3004 TaxID=1506994 RepID=UPI0018CC6572|nr:DUF6465 family protein [Butyrivibrio sp. AE3004]